MKGFVFWALGLPLLSIAIMYFLHDLYFAGGVCTSDHKLNGKTVVITGANTGIGKETALGLAMRGAHVVMACRNLVKCTAAMEYVKMKAKSKSVEVMELDLSSMESVDSFAENFRQNHQHLHILINNAGVFATPQGKTKDGFETQMGINHLGHFLLTNLLLDMLEDSGPGSRIVTVSSMLHGIARNFNVSDLMMESKPYAKYEQYGNTKLANILFTKELAKQLKGSGVNTYVLHPGSVSTEAGRNLDSFMDMIFLFLIRYTPIYYAMKTPWEGAQTTICCAASEQLADESGYYYSDCARAPTLVPQAEDAELASQLWEKSMELVGLKTEDLEE